MSLQEKLGFAIFVAVFSAIPLVVVSFVFHKIKTHTPFTQRQKILLGVFFVEIFSVCYGLFWEPTWLETSHIHLSSNRLPPGFGLKILQLSDLHIENTSGSDLLLKEALKVTSEQKPDIIVITGDFLNCDAAASKLEYFIRELRTIAPVYAIAGNWDNWIKSSREILNKIGLPLLHGKSEYLKLRGKTIAVAGISYMIPEVVPEFLRGIREADYGVALVHMPDFVDVLATSGVDLYLCGHTHGGQIRLPFYGAIVTLSKTGKKYESGLYRVGNTVVYTNRGLGMEGVWAPRVRFLCRPEIAIFHVN